MKSIRLTLFIILISCLGTVGQSHRIDSLKQVLKTQKEDTNKVNVLNDLSIQLDRQAQYKSSDSAGNVALQLAEKLNYKQGQAMSYHSIGYANFDMGNYDESLKDYLQAVKLNEEISNKLALGKVNCDIGGIYRKKGDYMNALSYYLKGLKVAEETTNKDLQVTALIDIGTIYQYEGEYSNALDNLKKALSISQELNNKQSQATDLCIIAIVCQNQKNYLAAISYYQQSIYISRQIGNKYLEAVNLGNIGTVYGYLNEYSKALDYSLQAMNIEEEIGSKSGVANKMGNIGFYYTKTGKFKEAEKYLKEAIAEDSALGDMFDLQRSEEHITDLYDTIGRYKESIIWFRKAMSLKDTLFNMDKHKELTRKEVTYQFERKEAAEKAEQDKKDAQQKIIIWSIVSGLLLVLVFAAFIFRSLSITRKQKQLIEIKSKETEEQKKVIEEKQKDILDSITYAKRLQDAILPPLSLVKQYLPESFLLYKPKDIVAGDFYWMERTGDSILIAAADCTGHGVPGAMVSVVCSNALNRTVKEFKITETGKILDKVRELVLETFSHRDPSGEKSEGNIQDGMDISLCCINIKTSEVQWSGAYNSLWYVQKGVINEVQADKQPIGKTDNPLPFRTHTLKLGKGDTLYLFTDGYADQFGGPKGKKFKYKQMQEILLANSAKSVDEQKTILGNTINEWKGELEQVDDILIIGIKV